MLNKIIRLTDKLLTNFHLKLVETNRFYGFDPSTKSLMSVY